MSPAMDAATSLCQDGMQDQDESDVDCGGSTCPKCGDRLRCGADADCASGTCAAGACASCSDAVRDGAETDVDCGGPTCAACDIGRSCARNRDCASGACAEGRCTRPLGTISFAAGVAYPVGDNPIGIGAGDFNGDGNLDLATPAFRASAVYVLIGRGNGAFVVQAPLAAAAGVQNVAVADFDEDGRADIAVGSSYDALVRLWLNGLKRTTQLAWHGSPSELVAADFDGDHHADIAAVPGNAALVLVRGDGKGGFTMPADIPLDKGSAGQAIATGDLNGDVRADLATALSGSKAVQIVLGAKNGMLQPGFVFNAPILAHSVVVGDVDGDGWRDVVLGTTGYAAYVLLGDGKGNLAQASTANLPHLPLAAARADFNRDGFDDVAFGCDSALSSSVEVLFADGKGGLRAGPTLSVPGQVLGLVAADFDRDGKPDLAAAVSITKDSQVTVFLNTSH